MILTTQKCQNEKYKYMVDHFDFYTGQPPLLTREIFLKNCLTMLHAATTLLS